MLVTSLLVFAIATFFVVFLIRSAHDIAKGKMVTVISMIAWVFLLSGLYMSMI